VLVNGKPFFDKDGKIALQSLPSDIINKVQVSDTKTKKEEVKSTQLSAASAIKAKLFPKIPAANFTTDKMKLTTIL
jgi:hypothetical protein